MRTFTIGDIHGGHLSLKQCLERCGFDKEKDRLISLGDLADGWPNVFEVVEELMTIKNLIVVRGNHDQWLLDWLENPAKMPSMWVEQGGKATLKSYNGRSLKELERHKKFFRNTIPYFIDEENRVYVHGGFHPSYSMDEHKLSEFMWDRRLAEMVLGCSIAFGKNDLTHVSKSKMRRVCATRLNYDPTGSDKKLVPNFKDVFLGHTTTFQFFMEPVSWSNVYLLDQGGGWEGKLSIMNVETKDFWQSDLLENLYPDVKGRR